MTTLTNAAGELIPTPALARGVPAGIGLTGLMDLDQSGQPADLVAKWRGTAIASLLGQLAATVPASSAKVLKDCCGLAGQRKSLSGIEPVFLSALLGTDDSAPEMSIAEATWNALPAPKVSSSLLIPVLDPVAADVCFLSSHDLAGITGLALKAQLAAMRKTHAMPAGAMAGQLAFGAAVLLSATAVMSAVLMGRLPDTAPEKVEAVAALGPDGGSPGLALQLARGWALLVQTELIADTGGASLAPPAGWQSVWPQTETVPANADPAETARHPYWEPSHLCPSRPVTGAGLAGQVLHRENTLILQSVPQVGPDGSVLRQGCYPKPPAPSPGGGGWRWAGIPGLHPVPATPGVFTIPTQPGTGLVIVQWPAGIGTGPLMGPGGTPIDPLTGLPIGPHGRLIPGQGGNGPPEPIIRQQLVTAVQNGRFPTTAQLEDVLQWVVATDYETGVT